MTWKTGFEEHAELYLDVVLYLDGYYKKREEFLWLLEYGTLEGNNNEVLVFTEE